MPLIFAFPHSPKKPPHYTAAHEADGDVWRIMEDSQPLGIRCDTQVEALAVATALNFKRSSLRHVVLRLCLPVWAPFYVN